MSFDKWERVLTRFTFTYSTEDGWELDRFLSKIIIIVFANDANTNDAFKMTLKGLATNERS